MYRKLLLCLALAVFVTTPIIVTAAESQPCSGSSVSFSWEPVNLPNGPAGYKLYYGTHDGFLDQSVDLGDLVNPNDPDGAISYTFEAASLGLADGVYYFAVTAYDTVGNGSVSNGKDIGSESPLSDQLTVNFCQ